MSPTSYFPETSVIEASNLFWSPNPANPKLHGQHTHRHYSFGCGSSSTWKHIHLTCNLEFVCQAFLGFRTVRFQKPRSSNTSDTFLPKQHVSGAEGQTPRREIVAQWNERIGPNPSVRRVSPSFDSSQLYRVDRRKTLYRVECLCLVRRELLATLAFLRYAEHGISTRESLARNRCHHFVRFDA